MGMGNSTKSIPEKKDEYEVEEVPIGNVNLSVHRREVNEEDRCGCLQRS